MFLNVDAVDYDIYLNPEKELMVVVGAVQRPDYKPHILYDGNDHAVLQLSDQYGFLFRFVSKAFKSFAVRNNSVLISHRHNGEIYEEYFVDVSKVDVLPIENPPPSLDDIMKDLEEAEKNGTFPKKLKEIEAVIGKLNL